MKVFTQEIDIALQSPKRFWVAPFSDFKIGVKIVKNGTPVDNEFAVYNGDTELTPDQDLTNGFTTYTLKSNGTGSVEYKVVVEGVGETLKITQITTDSTVFEVGSGGGDVPSDVATKSWVETYVSAETSAFIDETALAPYAKTSDVTSAISTATTDMATQTWVGQQGYASQSDLSIYATTSAMESYVSTTTSNFITDAALTPYAKTSDVASTYATKTELSDYATTSAMTSAISTAIVDMATQTWVGQQGYASQNDLASYATTSAMEAYVSTATSSFITSTALTPYAKTSDVASTYATKTELSDYATTSAMTSAISAATSNKVTGGAIGLAPVVSSAVAVYASVWASMSASADPNTLYVVLSDPS